MKSKEKHMKIKENLMKTQAKSGKHIEKQTN